MVKCTHSIPLASGKTWTVILLTCCRWGRKHGRVNSKSWNSKSCTGGSILSPFHIADFLTLFLRYNARTHCGVNSFRPLVSGICQLLPESHWPKKANRNLSSVRGNPLPLAPPTGDEPMGIGNHVVSFGLCPIRPHRCRHSHQALASKPHLQDWLGTR